MTHGSRQPGAGTALNARSYAELLQPIPNAVALLMASDAVLAARAKAEAEQDPNVKLAQYYHHHHGQYLIGRFRVSFPDFFKLAPTLFDFLESIDRHIHVTKADCFSLQSSC